MAAHLLLVDGTVKRKKFPSIRVDEIRLVDLNPEYSSHPGGTKPGVQPNAPLEKGVYMMNLDDYFIVMHEDNDDFGEKRSTELPVNQALRKYFPSSPYVGNILVVKADDADNLVPDEFDLAKVLGEWEMRAVPATEFLGEFTTFRRKGED